MANGFFTPGGPMGPFQPGSSGIVNPLSLMLAGIYQGNPVGALSAAGTLEQNAIAQRQAQAAQMATMALQRARETRLADDARKAAEGAQAVSGSLYSLLAGDLQTEQNRKALEGAANVPGGPAALFSLWTQQAGLAQPESYRMLTPEEVAATPNLDEDKAYQISPTGQISPVGGQPLVQVSPFQPPTGFMPDPERPGQVKRIPGYETEAERKERTAQEGFQTSFEAYDRAAHRLMTERSKDALAAFRTSAEQFAEDLAGRRAAPRSPTDADVERALRQVAGLTDIGLGTYQSIMDQLAVQFDMVRPELDWGQKQPEPGGLTTDEQSELEELERLEALEAGEPEQFRFGRRLR